MEAPQETGAQTDTSELAASLCALRTHFKAAVLHQSDTRYHLSTLTSSSEFNSSEKGGQTALTSFSLSYFFLTSLIRLSSDGERSTQPRSSCRRRPPFTLHQTARVMEGFPPSHWPLRAAWLSLWSNPSTTTPHNCERITRTHTQTHTHSSLIHSYKSKTDMSVPSVFIWIPRLNLIHFFHLH